MSEFKYLPAIIPACLSVYFFILVMYKYRCCCKCQSCKGDNISVEDLSHKRRVMLLFRFEDSYESFLPGLKYVLFITRFLSFCFIGGVPVIANYVARGTDIWFYFTIWNTKLIAIFFFFATISSIIGFVKESGKNNNIDGSSVNEEWEQDVIEIIKYKKKNYRIIWLGRVVHVMYEVCGGTAVLVTLINYVAIDSAFTFWNVSQHLINILVLVLELFLNNMSVRADHYPFNLSWAMLYLIFIWSVVAMNGISFWPYSFLATDTYFCFFYYVGLLIADIAFYYIFYSLSLLKYFFRNKLESSKVTRTNTQDLHSHVEYGDIALTVDKRNFT